MSGRDELALFLLRAQHPENPDRPLPMVRAGCAQLLADKIIDEWVLDPAVLHIHHHDIEKHAESYAQDWLDAHDARVFDEAIRWARYNRDEHGRDVLDRDFNPYRKDEHPLLMEEGRRLANRRDDLIASGVDPGDLEVPLAPAPDDGGPAMCGWWVGPVWKLDGETCVCVLVQGHDGDHQCTCGAWFSNCGHPPGGDK